MPDLGRFLPLSHRSPTDESDVTSDRRAQLADVIDLAAAAVESWQGVAGDHTPDDVAAAITAFLADARLARTSSAANPAELHEFAASVRGGPRRSIRDLSRAVRALLLLGRRTQSTFALDPLISGSVALYAATAAPLPRRAVVSGHTLRATDAEWEFGRGPVLEATAEEIIAFLLGISEIPPITPPVA